MVFTDSFEYSIQVVNLINKALRQSLLLGLCDMHSRRWQNPLNQRFNESHCLLLIPCKLLTTVCITSLQAGWKETHLQFATQLKNLTAQGVTEIGPALKNAFDMLNMNRNQSGIDTYGQVNKCLLLQLAAFRDFVEVFRLTRLWFYTLDWWGIRSVIVISYFIKNIFWSISI